MKKRVIIVSIIFVIIAMVVVGGIGMGKRPYRGITPDDIIEADVRLLPPDIRLAMNSDEISELADILDRVVIYGRDDSHSQYEGQAVVFTIRFADGTQTEITAYNPFLIIDGVGYKTKTAPCEQLSQLGNNLESQKDGATPEAVEPVQPPTETTEYVDLYIAVLDSYFDYDPGLHEGMTYIAIDMDTLEHSTENDQAAIAQYFAAKYGIETMDASMEDLVEKGLVGDGGSLDGVLLSVESIDIDGDSATVTGSKYRSGLGANGFESMAVKKDGVWVLESTAMTWIS